MRLPQAVFLGSFSLVMNQRTMPAGNPEYQAMRLNVLRNHRVSTDFRTAAHSVVGQHAGMGAQEYFVLQNAKAVHCGIR